MTNAILLLVNQMQDNATKLVTIKDVKFHKLEMKYVTLSVKLLIAISMELTAGQKKKNVLLIVWIPWSMMTNVKVNVEMKNVIGMEKIAFPHSVLPIVQKIKSVMAFVKKNALTKNANSTALIAKLLRTVLMAVHLLT